MAELNSATAAWPYKLCLVCFQKPTLWILHRGLSLWVVLVVIAIVMHHCIQSASDPPGTSVYLEGKRYSSVEREAFLQGQR